MSQPFIGEIRMFGGSFAPSGYAFTDGQLVSVSQLSALFSLIGTTYGGDGVNTFALPDLRGRVPIHTGTGVGLSNRALGSKGGSEEAFVSSTQYPIHGHDLLATTAPGNSAEPGGKAPAPNSGFADAYVEMNDSPLPMATEAIVDYPGGAQAHDNVQPFIVIHFIIALSGTVPSM